MQMQALTVVTLLPVATLAAFWGGDAGSAPWTFSLLATNGTVPEARQGHAAVEVGRKIYVIGGCLQEIKCFDDVHVFDTGSHEWSKETFSGKPPKPRGGHTATLVGSDIFIMGGANSEEGFGDVHRLDLAAGRWTQFAEPSTGAKPARRTSHAAAADENGRIYFFGGYDADGNFLNDLWILHTKASSTAGEDTLPEASWARPVPTGELPAAREGHSLTLVDRKLLLFGGYTENSVNVNDAHLYDIDGQQWTKLELAGEAPSPRQAHSAARHGHEVVVAGGCDVSGAQPHCFSDVWSLSLLDMRWTRRSPDAVAWKAREGHSASFVGGRMFAFGGCQLTSDCFGDMMVLDTLDPCPSGCGNHGLCVDGLYCKCTTPGFTGHDCMQPLSCKLDCGLHGACGQDGQCACREGWGGSDCTMAPRCPGSPLPCSGRGECLPGGRCKCQPGAGGLDCFGDEATVPALSKVAVVKNSSQAATVSSVLHGAATQLRKVKLSSLLETNWSWSDHTVLHLAPPPPTAVTPSSRETAADFGIDHVNKEGHVSDGVKTDCENNCNWRGMCEAAVCYCQPAYTGKACEIFKEEDVWRISIVMTCAFAGATFLASAVTTFIFLNTMQRRKATQERETGYV
eukprot:TRINITY_DN29148_c0_g1_i1.p1 TRINITY_DN29148_c0_g1~~TRINITY_DN29148_c0_g1_i1.p1  ORF type:complete len:662 (-),score=119.61 TRINITY_DN29148_c0_g1_i1:39-1916(-)